MLIPILAFAENLNHHYNDDNEAFFDFLSDDEAFPPLNSTTTGFEMVSDDVLFAGEDTVWVNAFSYAEAAEHGGIIHEPFNVDISPTRCTRFSSIRKTPAVDDEYGDDDNNSYIDTVYYDVKSRSADRAAAENTVFARKLKTAKYIHLRVLANNIRNLPDIRNDMTQEDAEKVRDAKAMVSGCDTIMAHLESNKTRYSYYRDRFYNRVQVKEWHNVCRRRMLREYRNDPVICRLDNEFETNAREDPHSWASGCYIDRMSGCKWSCYEFTRNFGFSSIRLHYSDIINYTAGVDPNITRKERIRLIRYALPAKKYLGSKLTRTQYACAILDEHHC
ncbi:hypothetical protein BJV82DRAFT_634130 [Fennellomyces sp. T-0311]|nr:hypothetical protein BJV82DRAFT_634130 [Fennellomyces sp. T-0311]